MLLETGPRFRIQTWGPAPVDAQQPVASFASLSAARCRCGLDASLPYPKLLWTLNTAEKAPCLTSAAAISRMRASSILGGRVLEGEVVWGCGCVHPSGAVQVHNVSFAFELMLDGGLKKPKARPEDVVNLDLKSTLRVLYNLFTKYKHLE
ncbi:hypothetical protein J1605_020513 [Eschrichtius robustus]|uniref:Uncharacterized protein n=1 Tax=Eschrichtius robustus TaxID=9764 RepID=A0AB34HJA9_ESCRO|nr:hypothetical protein J1605_020513 [Eschrichtius robustus]